MSASVRIGSRSRLGYKSAGLRISAGVLLLAATLAAGVGIVSELIKLIQIHTSFKLIASSTSHLQFHLTESMPSLGMLLLLTIGGSLAALAILLAFVYTVSHFKDVAWLEALFAASFTGAMGILFLAMVGTLLFQQSPSSDQVREQAESSWLFNNHLNAKAVPEPLRYEKGDLFDEQTVELPAAFSATDASGKRHFYEVDYLLNSKGRHIGRNITEVKVPEYNRVYAEYTKAKKEYR
jgi:hypothetical protein